MLEEARKSLKEKDQEEIEGDAYQNFSLEDLSDLPESFSWEP